MDPTREILIPMGAPGVTVFCVAAEVPTLNELVGFYDGDELILDTRTPREKREQVKRLLRSPTQSS